MIGIDEYEFDRTEDPHNLVTAAGSVDTELHTYIVDDADEPVWFANDDSSTYIWRSGAGLIAVAAVPLLLGMYAFAAHSGPAPGSPWVFAITTLPIVAIALGTAVAYLVDRRRIVRMRLRTVPGGPPVLEMTRANGCDARYPLSAVRRIDAAERKEPVGGPRAPAADLQEKCAVLVR